MERLFNVPLHVDREETRAMFVRGDGPVSTDTYFGCFDCGAYARHTTITKIRACAEGDVQWLHVDQNGRETQVGESATVSLEAYNSGYLYAKCDELPREMWYEGEGTAKPLKLAIIICTFKREEMVLKNLRILNFFWEYRKSSYLKSALEDSVKRFRSVPIASCKRKCCFPGRKIIQKN